MDEEKYTTKLGVELSDRKRAAIDVSNAMHQKYMNACLEYVTDYLREFPIDRVVVYDPLVVQACENMKLFSHKEKDSNYWEIYASAIKLKA